MLPRVGIMYLISALALFIYVGKFPERLWPGMCNIFMLRYYRPVEITSFVDFIIIV